MTARIECSHVYGTRTRCLKCGEPAPAKPRPRLVCDADEVDDLLRERPGVLRGIPGTARSSKRSVGVEDVAGWGEAGDPWMGGAA